MPLFLGMNYEKIGKGPPMLLLHGWGGSAKSWAKVYAELKNDFTLYVVDFWGFGKSCLPKYDANLFDYMNVIAKFCEEIIGKSCVVVGHSFGGRVAILLACICPNLVKKLVLVDSAGVLPKFNFKRYFLISKYKKLKYQVEKGRLDKSVLDKFGSTDYKNLDKTMRKVFVNVVNFDLLPFSKGIKAETLLFWGKFDKETPLYMAKRLKGSIKNSKLVVINGGHFCYLDNTEAFIKEIYQFLGDKYV